jgi:HTH-type transcriptional regulator, sugar sensing transcriptional regulator
MELKQKLESIGLYGKTAEVYLAALQLGKATVLEISKKAGVKRPTTYDILEELIQRHLITQTMKGKRRLFIAEDPNKLQETLNDQAQRINEMMPELLSFYNISEKKPKIVYYDTVEGLRKIYNDYLTVKNSKLYYFGQSQEEVALLGQEFMDDWINRRIKSNVFVYGIRIKSKEIFKKGWESGKRYLREIRFFPANVTGDFVNIVIYGNKVSIVSSKKEQYGIIIESKELSTALLHIFNVVWNVSEKA